MKPQDEIPLTETESRMPRAKSDPQVSILLAEDDRALRRFLEVTLERAGYRVIAVSDGLEGMKAVVTTSIDLVITDSMMPNLNGYEFCRFLRSSQKLAQLPIILLSALDPKEVSHNVEQADVFLPKPVSGEDLIECIEKLLAERRGEK